MSTASPPRSRTPGVGYRYGVRMMQREDVMPSYRTPLDEAFVNSIRSVADLLQWHDDVFLEAAYHIMLRRPIDPGGRHYYLSRLRSGRSRLAILDQLSKGAEANPRVEQVKDLQSELSRYRASRHPLKGLKVRWTDLEIGTRGSFVRTRVMSNALGRTRQDILLACTEVLAAQRDLSRAASQQGATARPADSPAATPAGLPPVVRAPRIRTSFDVREIDFHDTEKRMLNSLRI